MPPLPPALVAATAADDARRVPLDIDGCRVGSVARAHLPVLARCAASTPALSVADDGVALHGGPSPSRDAGIDRLNRRLHDDGAIAAWRGETVALPDPRTLRTLALIERAAARFWGTLTFGAHLNARVADPGGGPARLWVARRSPAKATDPGLFDNLVGGGVGAGQTPLQALVREAGEEAGLRPSQLTALRAGPVLRLHRDVAEGRQHEWLYAYDVDLPPDVMPFNADGEVAAFALLPADDAVALACGRVDDPPMTVDAAVVTIDFACRHRWLADASIAAALRRLHAPTPQGRPPPR